MKNIVPKVAAIQDLSGYGRCSLAVIVPVLSCMGIQVCSVPTAILSTHTGGFGTPSFWDLTPMLEEYIGHWKRLEIDFDGIYSGFLGNEKQIDYVLDFFSHFKKSRDTLLVVDPVMGDDGKLYKTYTPVMRRKMKQLVAKADLITPNWTEACFLLDHPYCVAGNSQEEVLKMLEALAALGPKEVVITGVMMADGKKVNAAYDRENNNKWLVPYEEIPVAYPGTGDIFTSVLVGALLQGDDLLDALKKAAEFVALGVRITYQQGCDTKEGILLEKILHYLVEDRQ